MSANHYGISNDSARARATRSRKIRNRSYYRLKRLFDIVVAACGLLLTWPLIAGGALAVKLTSPGPVFYSAKRAGRGGKPFYMFKLRTMRANTDVVDRRITADQDDRITRVGRPLRKYKIDELPQFWHVLRGDMSIVGPRPEDWDIVEKHYTAEQRRTLDVRPGVTSMAEVRWYPDLTYHDPPPPGVSIQEWYVQRHLPARLDEELLYLAEQSMLLDLKLVAKTLYCVLVLSWRPPAQRPLVGHAERACPPSFS